MHLQPTTHVRLDTLHTLVFPDGSVLRGCRRRGYLPQPGCTGLTCEWFLFHGKNFSRNELDRWGVLVLDEGNNAAAAEVAIGVRTEMRARSMVASLRFSDQGSREFQAEMLRLRALIHWQERQQRKEAATCGSANGGDVRTRSHEKTEGSAAKSAGSTSRVKNKPRTGQRSTTAKSAAPIAASSSRKRR